MLDASSTLKVVVLWNSNGCYILSSYISIFVYTLDASWAWLGIWFLVFPSWISLCYCHAKNLTPTVEWFDLRLQLTGEWVKKGSCVYEGMFFCTGVMCIGRLWNHTICLLMLIVSLTTCMITWDQHGCLQYSSHHIVGESGKHTP